MQSQWILLSLFLHWSSAKTPLQEFISSNKLFTVSFYNELRQTQKGNFFVSPFSAEMILALVQSGAKGSTAKELNVGLHLPRDQKKIESAIEALNKSLRQKHNYTLKSANKIYVGKHYKIEERFKKIATKTFGSEVETIDFSKGDVAAKAINQWVKKETLDKIQNMVQLDELDDETEMVLISALYFKANWHSNIEFFVSDTETGQFYRNFDRNVSNIVYVDTMHAYDSRNLNFFKSESLNATFLEILFSGGEASMTFVLPNKKDGLSALEDQMEEVLRPVNYTKKYVIVSIPTLKIECTLDLKEILQKIGVKQAFQQGAADFSGIAGHKDKLTINSVIHKTLLRLSEDGVEAAPATATANSVRDPYPWSPYVFEANHPFMFFIKVKDLIVFVGRVMDPSKRYCFNDNKIPF